MPFAFEKSSFHYGGALGPLDLITLRFFGLGGILVLL